MAARERQLLGSLTIRARQPRDEQQRMLLAIDASDLVRCAIDEGVAGLLHANLERVALGAMLPAAEANQLEAAYRRTAAANMQRIGALRELDAALPRGCNAVTVLKGMALLEPLYRDPGLRATGDIDLHVAGAHQAVLGDTLRRLGYSPDPLYPSTHRRGSVIVDVHTHVLGADRIRARAAILAGGEAVLLAERQPAGFGDTLRRLSPAAEMLVALLHLMKHNADRLLWLIEINELAAGMSVAEWEKTVHLAEVAGQAATIARVGYLAESLLPHTATSRLAEAVTWNRSGQFERWILRRRSERGALPAWAPLWFFAGAGALPKLRAAWETMFPRPQVLRQVFDDAEAGICSLYARRLAQLLGLALR